MAIKFKNTTSSTAATVNDFLCIYKDENQTSQLAPVAELRLKRPGDSQPFVVYERPGVYHIGTIPTSIASFSCTRTRTLEPSASTGEIGGLVYHKDELAFNVTAASYWDLISYQPSYKVNFISTNSLTAINAAEIEVARSNRPFTLTPGCYTYNNNTYRTQITATYTDLNGDPQTETASTAPTTVQTWQGAAITYTTGWSGTQPSYFVYSVLGGGTEEGATLGSISTPISPEPRTFTYTNSVPQDVLLQAVSFVSVSNINSIVTYTIPTGSTSGDWVDVWNGEAITYTYAVPQYYTPVLSASNLNRGGGNAELSITGITELTRVFSYTLSAGITSVTTWNNNGTIAHTTTLDGDQYAAKQPYTYSFSVTPVNMYWLATVSPTNVGWGDQTENIVATATRNPRNVTFRADRYTTLTASYVNCGNESISTAIVTGSESAAQEVTPVDVWQGGTITFSGTLNESAIKPFLNCTLSPYGGQITAGTTDVVAQTITTGKPRRLLYRITNSNWINDVSITCISTNLENCLIVPRRDDHTTTYESISQSSTFTYTYSCNQYWTPNITEGNLYPSADDASLGISATPKTRDFVYNLGGASSIVTKDSEYGTIRHTSTTDETWSDAEQYHSYYFTTTAPSYFSVSLNTNTVPAGATTETISASVTKFTRTLSITPGYGWNAGGRGTITYVSGTGTSTSTTSEEVWQSITRTVWQGASITWSASAVSMYWNIDSGGSQTYPIGDSNITITPQITLRPEGISECVADTYDDWFEGDYYYVGITFQNYMNYICTIYGTQDSYVSIHGYTYYLDTYGPFYVDRKHDGEFVLSFNVGSGVTWSDIDAAYIVISAEANGCAADFTIMEI